MLTISPQGQLLSCRRKLAPTGSERLVWGQGSRGDVRVAHTPLGTVAAAICWENYVPLFRQALYEQGPQIWCAPTADARPEWQSTMVHVALESRAFVIGCNQFNQRRDFPEDYPALRGESTIPRIPDVETILTALPSAMSSLQTYNPPT